MNEDEFPDLTRIDRGTTPPPNANQLINYQRRQTFINQPRILNQLLSAYRRKDWLGCYMLLDEMEGQAQLILQFVQQCATQMLSEVPPEFEDIETSKSYELVKELVDGQHEPET